VVGNRVRFVDKIIRDIGKIIRDIFFRIPQIVLRISDARMMGVPRARRTAYIYGFSPAPLLTRSVPLAVFPENSGAKVQLMVAEPCW
jgi:hypothetical protein